MKWHLVVDAVLAAILANGTLAGIFGTRVRKNGPGPVQSPVLEWSLIGYTHEEQWEPCILQLDCWCNDELSLLQAEQTLLRLFNRELPESLGGVLMWQQFEDSDDLATPDRDGYYARALRFRFTPLRDRYDPAPTL